MTHEPGGREPLLLFQVMEQEYEALHGQLPPSYREARDEAARTKSGMALNEAMVAELSRLLARRRSAALCLSGGGIRSATFGLGVLQGLARRGLLDQFHYLSTVSGGGYVGSWLSSWIARVGLESVIEDLRHGAASRFNPESRQIRHLREYSNYLTPRLGLFTADTWTLIATYLRNLIINWLVWVPLILAVLAVPRLIIGIARWDPSGWFAGSHTIIPAIGFTGGLLCAILSIAYICLSIPSVREEMIPHYTFFWNAGQRERWMSDTQQSFFSWCLLPLLGAAFLLAVSWAWLRHEGSAVSDEAFLQGVDADVPPLLTFVGIGVSVHLLGWLTANVITFIRVAPRGGVAEGWRALRTFWGAYSKQELSAIVISGLVSGVGLWIVGARIFPLPGHEHQFGYYACFAAPLLLTVFLLGGAVYVGLASYWTSDQDREWWGRSSAWILIVTVVWAGLCTVVIFGPVWLFDSSRFAPFVTAAGGLTGVLALILGFSTRTRPNGEQDGNRDWGATVLRILPIVAAPAAIILLAAVLSLASGGVMLSIPNLVFMDAHEGAHEASLVENHLTILHHTKGWGLLAAVAWLAGFGFAMAWLININRFSLHAMYRNRLIRAYLGASNDRRSPNRFTGFDPRDNVEMTRLAPEGTEQGSFRLLHVVNIALNLVKKSKEKLAWQERKAESFTVSPLHAGSWRPDLGYRPASEYGRNKTGRAISLGTAVAISGAAASPNMGYHSSPAVTFLMTLFNIRLGWWLGNPGKAGERTYDKASPEFAITPVVQEALGFTNDENPYVYLSDGGHFENLGLYEMVLRRCRFILVVDAGRDESCNFQDLGNAIRKIRVDFGIPITMKDMKIVSREAQRLRPIDNPKGCALGTIEYSRVDGTDSTDDGVLIYLKPALCGGEPADIYNYAQTNLAFPHEPTDDQWFSESQFESYRTLGVHMLSQICGDGRLLAETGWNEQPLAMFLHSVEGYLAQQAPSDMTKDGLAATLRELVARSKERHVAT